MNRFLKSIVRIHCGIVVVGVLCLLGAWVWICQPVWVFSRESAILADAERMQLVVRTLSVDYYPRSYMNPENLEKSAVLIENHFRQAGGKVSRQRFTGFNEPFDNIRCLFDGPGDQRLVVGAHYDGHAGTPGADDNASGVAGLIELAYLLSNQELPCDVELVGLLSGRASFFRFGGNGKLCACCFTDGGEGKRYWYGFVGNDRIFHG